MRVMRDGVRGLRPETARGGLATRAQMNPAENRTTTSESQPAIQHERAVLSWQMASAHQSKFRERPSEPLSCDLRRAIPAGDRKSDANSKFVQRICALCDGRSVRSIGALDLAA